jgi:hypothetical protein
LMLSFLLLIFIESLLKLIYFDLSYKTIEFIF